MSYSIIGFGAVGQALARAFARQNIEVTVAGRRALEALAPQAGAISASVIPATLHDALRADVIFLAVPFQEHVAIANALPDWQGKTIIDATNAYGVPVEELGGLPSSAVIAKAFAGAKFVKGFNHLAAGLLAADPHVEGGRRVVFLASDNESAVPPVAALAEQLGFGPVWLGKLNEGGTLVQARGRDWAPLIFQDLVKPD
ncbi:NADPH-dependent F420 reductase [Burkholderia perseverans]|uniref:NADPH-dependent F420 reductase n=1 Tax=Burkholderia perseverans TaxID=2615214 RepID=UPI001FEEF686|nr:NAD(P)-binding domain-containing protein [Burkholderia perseverans]